VLPQDVRSLLETAGQLPIGVYIAAPILVLAASIGSGVIGKTILRTNGSALSPREPQQQQRQRQR
jgi:hypothetical protein